MSKSDQLEDLRKKIAFIADQISDAYWAACDDAQAAIDPRDVTDERWAVELLDEAYDVALRVESDPLGWVEGRSKF